MHNESRKKCDTQQLVHQSSGQRVIHQHQEHRKHYPVHYEFAFEFHA